jgi:hypothetical protein
MDFAALRSSIFEGEEEDALTETPIKDQLSRPLVGFPILMGIGSLGLWAFDKYSQDGKLLASEGEYNYRPFVVSALGLFPLGFGLGGLFRGLDAHDEVNKYEQVLDTAEAEMERLETEAAEKEAEEQAEAEQKHAESHSDSFFLNAASAPNTNTIGIYGSAVGQNPVATRGNFQKDIFGF